ncbi:MAG: hypothetical protein IJK33_05120 [Clostridia bacterium]|nr:hypothetical protein [Clostridia bacterium]
MQGTRKHGVFIDVALIIVVLAVFSSVLAAGFVAKFRNSETSDFSVGVATYDIDLRRSDSNNVSYVLTKGEFVPGSENNDYELTIVNRSETAVRYSVEFLFGEGVSQYVKVYRVTSEGKVEITPVNGRIVLEGDELAAGNTSAVETFAFAVDAANVPLSVYGALTPDESNPLQSTDVVAIDFDTCVKFVQID